MLGQCLEKAPVAFLQNFEAVCVRSLQSCPAAPAELRVAVRDEQGGESLRVRDASRSKAAKVTIALL